MPILLNGRDIFEVLITQYNQAVAKASQNNETTKAHAESLNKLNEKLENLKSSEKDLKNKLEKYGINVTIRREMGRDIDGACGQLRNKYMEDIDESDGGY